MLGSMIAFSTMLAAGTAALYEGLVVRTYCVTTSKWARGKTARFVAVSDLHSILFGKGQRDILSRMRGLYPDYILLPGDIVDEHRPPENARAFLRGVAGIAPTWYAPGNHEYRTRCMPAVVRMVERCGVTALLDEAVSVRGSAGPLLVAGCEDPEKVLREDPSYDWSMEIRRNFGQMGESDAFTVLLAHHPEHSMLYGELGFDLVLSGHAHGGQARLPYLLNGVVAPEEGFFPKYAGGCYLQGKTAHVVCRGVVVYEGIPRVFNPPEIVAIDVIGTGS